MLGWWKRRRLKKKLTRLSQTKLHDLATKTLQKVWQSQLDKVAFSATKAAEAGNKEIVMPHVLLRCEYNKTRTKDQIMKDIQTRFPGCTCYFDLTMDQQEIVKISWRKS
jgi:hypothetical protein